MFDGRNMVSTMSPIKTVDASAHIFHYFQNEFSMTILLPSLLSRAFIFTFRDKFDDVDDDIVFNLSWLNNARIYRLI